MVVGVFDKVVTVGVTNDVDVETSAVSATDYTESCLLSLLSLLRISWDESNFSRKRLGSRKVMNVGLVMLLNKRTTSLPVNPSTGLSPIACIIIPKEIKYTQLYNRSDVCVLYTRVFHVKKSLIEPSKIKDNNREIMRLHKHCNTYNISYRKILV